MKTNRYILSLLLLVVSAFNLLPANAQQNQYAIYNYRNDGDFNAWLNIDVDSITYSCIDTLGVEHDDVVVQEVWTPDSVYRIPINAIDSLAFRAPKPEFKDGIFHIVEAHVPYTVNVEDLTVTFSSDIPNSMLPSKGQVVISDIYEAPFDEGFAGRVVNIVTTGGQIRIECEEVGLDDVYDQLICVGKSILYEDDNSSKAKVPRKIKVNEDGTIEIPLGKFSLKISAPEEKDASINLSAKPTLYIDYTIVYNVKGVENQFKVAARSKVEYGIDFKIKVKKKSSSEEFLAFIPVETGIPGVRCKIRFGAFFEVEGSVSLDGGMTYTTETTSGFDSSVKENHGFFFNDKSGWEEPEVSLEMEGSVFFGPMVQVFVYLVYEKGFPSVKFNLKPGVEFSGKIVASSDAVSEYGFSAYDMLKDTKISLGCKLKAEASASFLGAKYDLPSYSLSPDWLKFEFHLFPKFTMPELQSLKDTRFNPTSLYSEVTREPFFPTKVGMAVFDEFGIDVTENFQLFKYNNIPWDETYISHNMNMYSAGKYVVRPVVNNWLGTFNASPVAEFTVPTPVEFETDNLTLQIGKSQSVAINGGWGDYSLGHLNKTACDAELKKEGDNYYIQLLGKAKGLAPITINDLRSGESTTLIVDVVEEAIDLALSETSLTLETNATAEVAITSGSGSYTVANSNEEVAVAAISNGDKVAIAALKAGTTTITVTDTKTKQTATITVMVKESDFPVYNGDIIIERDFLIHWANNNSWPGIYIEFDNGLAISVEHHHHQYYQEYGVLIKTFQYNGNVKFNEIRPGTSGGLSGEYRFLEKWLVCNTTADEWAHEKIVIKNNGYVYYYLNSILMGERPFEQFNLRDIQHFRVGAHPFGWYPGHYQCIDNLKVYNTAEKILFFDNFDKGYLDMELWEQPTRSSAVTIESGILKLMQDATDRDCSINSKVFPLK